MLTFYFNNINVIARFLMHLIAKPQNKTVKHKLIPVLAQQ
jgi:hypothetical protein